MSTRFDHAVNLTITSPSGDASVKVPFTFIAEHEMVIWELPPGYGPPRQLTGHERTYADAVRRVLSCAFVLAMLTGVKNKT